MFKIEFFETAEGIKPVVEFLNSLDTKMRVKVLRNIQHLQKNGYNLREPYSKALNDGIFELRTQESGNITRVLYFFYIDNTIVMTNGFVKKTQKTPLSEIEKALSYRKIYLQRKEAQKNG